LTPRDLLRRTESLSEGPCPLRIRATPRCHEGMTDRPRRLRQLTRDEALRRLASVSVGRLVFTIAGLPAIRPVNHLVDDGAVVVRSDLGSRVSLAEGAVETAPPRRS